MKKYLTMGMTLLIAGTLGACGSTSSKSSTSKQSSSTTTSKKVSQSSSSVSINSSSSSVSSSSETQSDKLSAQISTNEWYILAYTNTWGGSSIGTVDDNPNLELYMGTDDEMDSTNGELTITQGTVDSTAFADSVTSTTVTIAPSSGEGATSTFTPQTVSKAELMNKYVHNQADLDRLAALTQNAVNIGQADSVDQQSSTSDESSN